MENKDPYLSSQEQAKELFKNVQNNQTRFGVVSTAEIEQLRRDYIDRAQRRIDIYRENEHEHLETVMREIDEQRISKLNRIKVAYDENNTYLGYVYMTMIAY